MLAAKCLTLKSSKEEKTTTTTRNIRFIFASLEKSNYMQLCSSNQFEEKLKRDKNTNDPIVKLTADDSQEKDSSYGIANASLMHVKFE